jgi:DNA replication and repair protein RecF
LIQKNLLAVIFLDTTTYFKCFSAIVKKNNGKQVFLNQKPYQKLSEHIGKIPIIVIAPQDLSLITDYADTRRKFIDALISKLDKEYLQALIQYQAALQNRNALLKQGETAYSQQDLIDIYNLQLVQFGSIVLQKRISFFNEIKETLSSTYQLL